MDSKKEEEKEITIQPIIKTENNSQILDSKKTSIKNTKKTETPKIIRYY